MFILTGTKREGSREINNFNIIIMRVSADDFSYGIQGVAGSFVTAIQGDFYNVMGLPLHRTCKEILKLWDRGLL